MFSLHGKPSWRTGSRWLPWCHLMLPLDETQRSTCWSMPWAIRRSWILWHSRETWDWGVSNSEIMSRSLLSNCTMSSRCVHWCTMLIKPNGTKHSPHLMRSCYTMEDSQTHNTFLLSFYIQSCNSDPCHGSHWWSSHYKHCRPPLHTIYSLGTWHCKEDTRLLLWTYRRLWSVSYCHGWVKFLI